MCTESNKNSRTGVSNLHSKYFVFLKNHDWGDLGVFIRNMKTAFEAFLIVFWVAISFERNVTVL